MPLLFNESRAGKMPATHKGGTPSPPPLRAQLQTLAGRSGTHAGRQESNRKGAAVPILFIFSGRVMFPEFLDDAGAERYNQLWWHGIVLETRYVCFMKQIKIIIEKHRDGYVAYPVGIQGIVVGEGDTYEEALKDVQSALKFHIETFGLLAGRTS